jgi:hypothetical protein
VVAGSGDEAFRTTVFDRGRASGWSSYYLTLRSPTHSGENGTAMNQRWKRRSKPSARIMPRRLAAGDFDTAARACVALN